MKFYYFKNGVNNYAEYKNSLLIIKDNWDDWFTYETNNYVMCVDEEGKVTEIGAVKIAQMDMKEGQRTADIPSSFDILPNNFFSLGQSDDYYSRISSLGDILREKILIALRDIAYDQNLFSKVKNLAVTKISLMKCLHLQ